MKNTRKKLLAMFMALVLCISVASMPTYAEESLDNSTGGTPRLNTLLNEGGVLYNNDAKIFHVTVSKNTLYTITASSQPMSGSSSGRVWFVVQKPGENAVFDKSLSSETAQERVSLSSGTYTVQLIATGSCSYFISINETYS